MIKNMDGVRPWGLSGESVESKYFVQYGAHKRPRNKRKLRDDWDVYQTRKQGHAAAKCNAGIQNYVEALR